MEKFTKGEWQIMPIEDDKEYIIIRGTVLGGRFKIANICHPKFYHETTDSLCRRENEESIANANLISVATEMYDMLRTVLATQRRRYGDGMGLHIDMISLAKKIEALLAKARGEK